MCRSFKSGEALQENLIVNKYKLKEVALGPTIKNIKWMLVRLVGFLYSSDLLLHKPICGIILKSIIWFMVKARVLLQQPTAQ